jgi:hypothetical protein
VGTGRFNIIGRIPHPEWKGPATSHETNGIGTIPETQDDFSIPSTTATQTNDLQQPDEAMAAKIEGFGLSHAHIETSPSFAQTMRSSDELVAASSTASTPANLTLMTEEWTNSDRDTPQTATKDSPPTTPDTPTPLQRRRDTPTEAEPTPTKDTSDGKDTSDLKPEAKDTPANGTPATPSSAKKNTPTKLRIALAPSYFSPARNVSTSKQ